MIPVLFGITVITFFLLRLIPGDPARQILGQHYTPASGSALRHALGLDRPLVQQYLLFMKHLFHGNLGDSISYHEPARTVISDHFMPTLFLVVYSALIATIISIPAGIISALRRGGVFDQTARVTTLVGFAMPSFWLGIILILIFSIHLQLFPVNGYGNSFVEHLYHLFLPALTISIGFSTILRADAPLEHARRALIRLRRHGADQGHQPVRGASAPRLPERDGRRRSSCSGSTSRS